MEESGEDPSTDLEIEPFHESTFSEMESKFQTIMQRDAFSQLRLAFFSFSFVLLLLALSTNAWYVNSIVKNSDDVLVGDQPLIEEYSRTELGLFESHSVICEDITSTNNLDDERCNELETDYSQEYENCSKLYPTRNNSTSALYDACEDIGAFSSAGLFGFIPMTLSCIGYFVCSIFAARRLMNPSKSLPHPFFVGTISAHFFGVMIWMFMLPDLSGMQLSFGFSAWFSILSIILAILIFFESTFSWAINGPTRLESKGVRASNQDAEFPIKESSDGNMCLSLVVDEDILKMVRAHRIGATKKVEDLLVIRKETFSGYTHVRYDWLDTYRQIWWVLLGTGVLATILLGMPFLLLVILGGVFTVLQIMDPEKFSIVTSSGSHRFFVNRWRSNRELTDYSMEHIDQAFLSILSGNPFDTTAITKKAEQLANNHHQSLLQKQSDISSKLSEKVVNMNESVDFAHQQTNQEIVQDQQQFTPVPNPLDTQNIQPNQPTVTQPQNLVTEQAESGQQPSSMPAQEPHPPSPNHNESSELHSQETQPSVPGPIPSVPQVSMDQAPPPPPAGMGEVPPPPPPAGMGQVPPPPPPAGMGQVPPPPPPAGMGQIPPPPPMMALGHPTPPPEMSSMFQPSNNDIRPAPSVNVLASPRETHLSTQEADDIFKDLS